MIILVKKCKNCKEYIKTEKLIAMPKENVFIDFLACKNCGTMESYTGESIKKENYVIVDPRTWWKNEKKVQEVRDLINGT